jgi:enoyl-CoA hydratase/carnithine racemase
MGEGDTVLYAVEQGVARITLNRPERLNASNRDLSRGLTDAFSEAAADPAVRVVLLSGAGRGFCAGADQEVLNDHAASGGQATGGSSGLRYDGLMHLPKPVIAACHGATAGVGLVMACCADIRIASANAFFLAPFSQLGLCAEGGLAWLLSRLMGMGHASEMLLSARRVLAEEALAKGLVSHVLPDEGFAAAAFDYAAKLAGSGSPASFAMMKQQLREVQAQSYEEARSEAGRLTALTLESNDFRRAIAARRDKSSPVFESVTALFDPPISTG